MKKLKDCPFCDGDPIITKEPDSLFVNQFYPVITCKNCGARTSKSEDETIAIKLWNKRK